MVDHEPHAAPDPLTSPRSYEDLVREGEKLRRSGHAHRAQGLFEDALKLQPEGPAALNGVAYGWLEQGEAQKAIPLFQRAFWKDAHLSGALFGLGQAYRALGRRKDALDAFRVYLLRFPAGPEIKAARKHVAELGGTSTDGSG
jgi:tetratricopeptide (TPR) repeat protein